MPGSPFTAKEGRVAKHLLQRYHLMFSSNSPVRPDKVSSDEMTTVSMGVKRYIRRQLQSPPYYPFNVARCPQRLSKSD